jgi:hypothetical protein
LTIDGHTQDQPFVLAADPRNPWTPADLVARHAYLSRLNDDISALDTLLNTIDAQETMLRRRHDAAALARIAQLDAVRDSLTANDLNDEDSVGKPDRIREQLFGASGAIGSSFQPPTAADAANADDVHARFERAFAAAKGVVGS